MKTGDRFSNRLALVLNKSAPVCASQQLCKKKFVRIGKDRSIIIFTNNFFPTFLFKIGSDNEEREKESEEEIYIDFDEIRQNFDNTCFEDDKIFFASQLSEMKHIFNTYGNQLILLDATYKATKYALPIFFLVVKTNVHFHVSATIWI